MQTKMEEAHLDKTQRYSQGMKNIISYRQLCIKSGWKIKCMVIKDDKNTESRVNANCWEDILKHKTDQVKKNSY